MKRRAQYIFPKTFELISLLLVTALIVILGSSRQLLDYYGLSSSKDVLTQGAGGAIVSGLSRLDSFSFTNQVVTFLIWAVIGLLCFSVAQAIARGYHEFQMDEELSSNRYVHPRSFTRRAFWRGVGFNFATTLLGLVLLIGTLYAYLAYILPIGLTYTRVFLQGLIITRLGYFVLGFAVLYVGVIALDLCLRFLSHRKQLVA